MTAFAGLHVGRHRVVWKRPDYAVVFFWQCLMPAIQYGAVMFLLQFKQFIRHSFLLRTRHGRL
jgi:hypothetical protein